MNIFYLDHNPKLCAEYHVDRHVIKMVLESMQLLCSAHHICPSNNTNIPYKLTHKNHPCAIWVRASLDNYLWLRDLLCELSAEYTYRYGKEHKCKRDGYIDWVCGNFPNIPKNGFTMPALAMPDNAKHIDPITAYRQCYNMYKRHLFKWKNRDIPYWIV